MTNPINNFQDILDALERDPALRRALRAHILTEELVQLPIMFQQLSNDVSELKQGQARLEADMAEVKANVAKLNVDMVEVKADVAQLKTDVRRIDGRLDRGFGANYEAKVSWNIRSILGQQLGVRNARVLKGPGLRNDQDFDLLLEDAENSGALTPEETDELLLSDLIVTGVRRNTQERVYAAVEASITLNEDDVQRSAHRANILAKLTKRQTLAVVVAAGGIDGTRRELAASRNVQTAAHPE